MARQAQIIATIMDVFGEQWDVREQRKTEHGFEINIGWPTKDDRGHGGRGVAVLLTQPLVQYLTETRPKDVTLPIGKTTIKRLRGLLGLKWSWDAYWREKEQDLLTLTLEEFCEKYGCSLGAASQRRTVARDRGRVLSFNAVFEEAKKFKTRSEFKKQSASAYQKAMESQWLDKICAHMSSRIKHTLESVTLAAGDCKTRGGFQQACPK